MKKLFVIACAFAAVIGCQKAEMEMPQENEGVKAPLKITASIAQTKTTMTNDGGVLKSAWKDGDKIYLQKFQHKTYAANANLEYTATVSGNSVVFDTESEGVVVPEANLSYYTILAEYPVALKSYGNGREFSMSDSQTQAAAGDLAHIASSNLMYAWGTPDWESVPVTVNFDFQHALSVLQLNLKGAEPGVILSKIEVEMLDETGTDWLVITSGKLNANGGGTITQTAGTNTMTLHIASPAELPTDGYAQFYMTISPGHAGQTFKVTATTDMGEVIEVGSMKVPAEGAIPQGAKAVKSFTVTPPVKEEIDYASAIDLSANGTANTYLVTAANTLYKFKADVKGNGFVPSALTAVGVGTTTVIAPKTALQLWYNCVQTSKVWVDQNPIEISTIILKDGYIYFKTPETFVNGNAVIAAFAEPGLTYTNITVDENRLLSNATILWSWNIWASEGYDIEADAFKAGDFTIMGRNIGAVVGKTEIDSYQTAGERKYVAASAIGNYYQWGNKNPYPHVSDYENYAVPNYGNKLHNTPTYTPVLALQVGTNANVAMPGQMFGTVDALSQDVGTCLSDDDRTPANIVAYTESAPYKYMKNSKTSYSYSWTGHIGGTALETLWGDATLEDVTDHVKTIYDPCPAGWKVWEDDAWDAMVTAGAETAYFVSNLSIYSSGFWGRKYLIKHAANFAQATDIELLIGSHLCTSYSTPLRCVKE